MNQNNPEILEFIFGDGLLALLVVLYQLVVLIRDWNGTPEIKIISNSIDGLSDNLKETLRIIKKVK